MSQIVWRHLLQLRPSYRRGEPTPRRFWSRKVAAVLVGENEITRFFVTAMGGESIEHELGHWNGSRLPALRRTNGMAYAKLDGILVDVESAT